MTGPSLFDWTLHARAKVAQEAWVPTDVEQAIAKRHPQRQRNPREADWILTVGRLVVAYNWPVEDDLLRARIVSVWRLPKAR